MVKAGASICLSNSCSSRSISLCLDATSSTPSRRVAQLQTLELVGQVDVTAMANQSPRNGKNRRYRAVTLKNKFPMKLRPYMIHISKLKRQCFWHSQ